MSLETIAILSPEDIGSALVERGYDVITCLTDRSHRTRDLEEMAGLVDVP